MPDLTPESILSAASNLGAAYLFYTILKDALKNHRDQITALVQVFREELNAERTACAQERAVDRTLEAEHHTAVLGRFDRLESTLRP